MQHRCRSYFVPIGLIAITSTASADPARMIVYAQEGTATPRSRAFSGSTWGAEQMIAAGAGEPKWMIAPKCPTRDETACLTYNANKRVYLSFHNGTSWSATTMLHSSAGSDHRKRGCDAVYESTTGDLLVAYWKGGRSAGIGYRTYSGASISAESTLALTGAADVYWVTLVRDPASDDAILLALDQNAKLFASVWSGTAFSAASQIGTGLQSKDYECYAAAYESGTGDAVIIYSQSGSGTLKYRVVSGGVIGAQQNGPTLGTKSINWLRAARSPVGQQIVIAALNSDKELLSATWDGSSWSATTSLATGLESNDKRGFDLAAEPTGGRMLIMYALSGAGTLKCRLWTGSSWGGVFNGPTGDGTHGVISLATGTSGSTIGIGVYGLDKDLLASEWNGTTFVATTEVSTASIGTDSQTQPFYLSYNQATAGEEDDDNGGGGSSSSRRVTRWKEIGR